MNKLLSFRKAADMLGIPRKLLRELVKCDFVTVSYTTDFSPIFRREYIERLRDAARQTDNGHE